MIGDFIHSSVDKHRKEKLPNILLSNMRSINNKFGDLKCEVKTLNPEVIVCTETWLDSNTPSEAVNMWGYDVCRTDRTGKGGRGGVAIWTKRYLRVKELPCPIFERTEVCCVQIPVMNIIIIGIYLPPGIIAPLFQSFCQLFGETVDKFLNDFPFHRLIVAGDFNQYDRSFLTSNLSLKNIVHGPTRVNATLDQIFVDRCIYDRYGMDSVEIGAPIGTSDHNTVFVRPKTGGERNRSTRRHIVYDLRHSNLLAFERRFMANDFEPFYCSHDINKKCELFYQFVNNAVQVIPSCVVYFNDSDVPWITPVIKCLINQRWEAFRSHNWSLYNTLKVKVKQEINQAKKRYFQKKSKSIKGMWSYVRMERGANMRTSFNFVEEGTALTDLLNTLNEHFCSVMNPPSTRPCTLKLRNDSWMPVFGVENVWRALTRLSSKAMGSDNIPTLLYKRCALVLAEPIYHLVFECIRQREFPLLWKIADVVPPPKTSGTSSITV